MGVGLLLLASSLSVITYHVEVPGAGGQAMRDRFTTGQLVLLQKWNRADLDHLHRLPVLMVPDVWVEDERMYSPMPHRAQWLFEWGDPWTLDEGATRMLKLGTPVLIMGDYDFDAAPPWQSAEWLARGAQLPEM